ncbi:MAG: winged helix-turn-helix transcriptional regulator [Candidatus Tectomicrobia bacterium]|nr:winged helix-turn-helix transcriptional regulator [Candidatus Tectomicrobia bacterium]
MPPALDATFAALADPTRRAILARLARGEASVTALAAPFRVSLPAVSKHRRVLERAGLLARSREGRFHRLRLEAAPLREAGEWIAFYRRFWEGQLDALARYLEVTASEENPPPPAPKPASPSAPPPSGRGRGRKRG